MGVGAGREGEPFRWINNEAEGAGALRTLQLRVCRRLGLLLAWLWTPGQGSAGPLSRAPDELGVCVCAYTCMWEDPTHTLPEDSFF